MSSPLLENNPWQPSSNHLFLEQAEGYVKVFKKSTSLFSTRERFLSAVLIGGMVRSTRLMLLVIPALYAFWQSRPIGRGSARSAVE